MHKRVMWRVICVRSLFRVWLWDSYHSNRIYYFTFLKAVDFESFLLNDALLLLCQGLYLTIKLAIVFQRFSSCPFPLHSHTHFLSLVLSLNTRALTLSLLSHPLASCLFFWWSLCLTWTRGNVVNAEIDVNKRCRDDKKNRAPLC